MGYVGFRLCNHYRFGLVYQVDVVSFVGLRILVIDFLFLVVVLTAILFLWFLYFYFYLGGLCCLGGLRRADILSNHLRLRHNLLSFKLSIEAILSSKDLIFVFLDLDQVVYSLVQVGLSFPVLEPLLVDVLNRGVRP